jgi:hypothetical protein
LPAFCAGAFALGLIGFERVHGTQEFGSFATTDLLALIASFLGGWILGMIGGLPARKLP